MVGSSVAHAILSATQISFVGANAFASSSVAVVTSIAPGRAVCWYVNDVPQTPQKLRVTPGDDAKVVGVPDVKRNPSDPNTTHATDGAPAASRHDTQWHKVCARAAPCASYRTAPHRHPPVADVVIVASLLVLGSTAVCTRARAS